MFHAVHKSRAKLVLSIVAPHRLDTTKDGPWKFHGSINVLTPWIPKFDSGEVITWFSLPTRLVYCGKLWCFWASNASCFKRCIRAESRLKSSICRCPSSSNRTRIHKNPSKTNQMLFAPEKDDFDSFLHNFLFQIAAALPFLWNVLSPKKSGLVLYIGFGTKLSQYHNASKLSMSTHIPVSNNPN